MNIGYRYAEQSQPPRATRASDVAVTRFDNVYEVDPELMQEFVQQQRFPNWDTMRIVNGRHDHLAWMHAHWATVVISGEELLTEVSRESS